MFIIVKGATMSCLYTQASVVLFIAFLYNHIVLITHKLLAPQGKGSKS